MSLLLTEDQQMLKQTAADFVKKNAPLSRFRQLRDGSDPIGFSRALWSKMAELGWPAILVPEQYGGLSMGFKEAACVIEECGRNLVPEPLLSSILSASTVLLAGSEEQKRALLPGIADGSKLVAVAHQERRSRYDACAIETRATRRGSMYTIDGTKTHVLDGHAADRLIVAARTSGTRSDREGVSLFVVEPGAPGVRITRQSAVDLRNTAIVELKQVEVGADALLGAEGGSGAALEEAIDRATLALAAETLGSMQAAFEMTVEYLKTRKQFGVLIGTFQALKHRAARMFIELELSRSAVLGACEAVDAGAPNKRAMISVAKARCSDAAVLVGYEGIQMHGGIGMTDEHDIGFYAKRARAAELTYGDAAFHRDRFAALQAF